jgi:hypothetical protein
MKILFISANSLRLFSESEHLLMEISSRLTKMNHEVYVVASEPPYVDCKISFNEHSSLFSNVK